ncbi:pirin family protein [Uruburuella suis]|jgi:redox-sensitive bicupin YhaK (pirin superfamily)|uniref:pirin family protein n=1 Tax=Uruburuella suis TaxID=252130 RepID=UPI002490AEED|nr:pirin family protein [Uruburuella suis]
MRTIRKIYNAPAKHWVGNGFYVSPLFSHMGEDKQTSPFLMFDYAMPHTFAPNNGAPRGVGAHPHSGFETVTIAYQGEVAHRDSTGSGGVIGEGDVQWMTAGAGIVHEEFHAESFGKRGGEFEMAQLWVNLPAKDKKTPARYQHLAKDNITVVPLADDAGHARIIAGRFGNTDGAAETFTELNVWDIVLNSGAGADLDVPASHNLMLVVLRGEVRINGGQSVQASQMATFERESGNVKVEAVGGEAKILLLSGVPIDEPVVGYGPFVMNTEAEIAEVMNEFRSGKFGAV